ncbi:MAG: amidase [Longimicrobiales bacterium]|nr:amidase [Longimicrobiales bacterium]
MIPRRLASFLLLGAVAACTRPQPIPVVELTIRDLHTALGEGRTTCRMVVDAHLDRIARLDEELGAITVVNPRARAVADSLDSVMRGGGVPGPLHCVPILVKDNFDTHDMVTTGGSAALAGSLPPDDATQIERARGAGAVVVAKTNMAEWAFSPRETVSSSFGRTRNAYALDRTPAGSSGGTASGIAASFGIVGFGSDTGNSIRGPSSHLALVGIRSTLGATSRDGIIPLAFDRDVGGPMGRTVEDVARVYRVVAGPDPKDPYTMVHPDAATPGWTIETLFDMPSPTSALQGARLGILSPLTRHEEMDTAVARVFDEAVEDLRRLGATVIEVDLDFALVRGPGVWCSRFRYDLVRYLESLGPDAPISDPIEAWEAGAFDPSIESTLRSALDAPADRPPSEWDEPCMDFWENPTRQRFRETVEAVMEENELAALIYPTWTWPPAPLDRANEEYRGDNSQRVAPASGLPAITVPMGYTYGNLPAGLQLLGRAFDEATLFRLAYAWEEGTRHRRPPEGFGELEAPPGIS